MAGVAVWEGFVMVARTSLWTGATGFLSEPLLRKVAEEFPEDKFRLVVRAGSADRARKRFDYLGGRSEIVVGDLGDEINPELAKTTDEVVHTGALTSLDDGDSEELIRTNFGGTLRILDFVKRCNEGRQVPLIYVSTSYDRGSNLYEKTKKLAREAVARSGLPAVVVAPSIIMEDAGVVPEKDGMVAYRYLEGIATPFVIDCQRRGIDFFKHWAEKKPIEGVTLRLIGDVNVDKDFVPVSYVRDGVRRVIRGVREGQIKFCQTFYATAERPLKGWDFANAIEAGLNLAQGSVKYQKEAEGMNPLETRIHGIVEAFDSYTCNSDPKRDSSPLRNLLGGDVKSSVTPEDLELDFVTYMDKRILPKIKLRYDRRG